MHDRAHAIVRDSSISYILALVLLQTLARGFDRAARNSRSYMMHTAVFRRYSEREISVQVDERIAMHVMMSGLMPTRYRAAYHLHNWRWMLSLRGTNDGPL